jgi:MFS transporter, FSR family, fosmidomycin resistance protein
METLTQPTTCPDGFKTGELAYGLEAGGMHALVDFACGAVVYREVAAARLPYEVLIGYVLFYNAMAFGLQAGMGWLADLRGHYRVVAAVGPWLVSIGVAFGISMPWVGAAMAGLGNACFHVGAAGALLPLCRGRTLAPGLFVGPGAIGIFAGVWTGANVGGWETVTLVLLMSVGIRLWFLVPSQVALPSGHSLKVSRGWVLLVAGALFASVTVRGVVAGVLGGEWRSSVVAGLALAISACCGKCLGGWLADRYGWRASAVTALVMSSTAECSHERGQLSGA